MPRPTPSSPHEAGSYLPGLDGLRAVAVVAVVGYHLGIPWFGGGLLGVGVFFTLSGFLITRILLVSFDRTGSFQLRRFWVHRARRLLPAVVLLLTVILTGTWLTDPAALGRRWGETWSALLYVANWHTIARGETYFDRFAGPGPLDHLWSLSVEEQFYVVWPLVLVLALGVARISRAHLALFTGALAASSFALLALLANPGFDQTRAYEGTDTRAGGLLVGALLAMGWPHLTAYAASRGWIRPAVHLGGLVGLVVIARLIATTDDYSMSIYHGGLLQLSLATAAVVASVSLADGPVARLLGVEPLRWIGERSYGIYLWQLPIISAAGTTALAEHRILLGIGLSAMTLLLADLSWRLVENPIRQHGLAGALRRIRRHTVRTRATGTRELRIPALPAGAACLLVLGTGTLVSCQTVQGESPAAVQLSRTGLPPVPSDASPATRTAKPRGPGAGADRQKRPKDRSATRPDGADGPTQTSCTSVAYIGESTSLGLVDPRYLPDKTARLASQLERHGVERLRTDIAGARSIVERWNDQPNAQEAAGALRDDGFTGCWIVAMGTNDAANQAVGGVYPYSTRVDLLMRAIGDEPVLWLTVKSLVSSGPYADANMAAFDTALRGATARYPNLRIYDWRSEVLDAWYVPDGIHFTSAGYAARSMRIAAALAQAYPAGSGPAENHVVGSGLR